MKDVRIKYVILGALIATISIATGFFVSRSLNHVVLCVVEEGK